MIRKLGQEVIYICDKWDRQNIDFLNDREDLFRKKISIDSLDSIEELSSVYIDLMEEGFSIDKVISGAEYGIFAYGFLTTLFEKTSNGVFLSINSRDKRAMKDIFEKSGIKYAKYYPNYSFQDLTNHVNHGLDYPIVIKPITGTGTFNTEIIKNVEELSIYFEKLTFHPALVNKKVTLEEYIVGEEYHVDILWKDGKALFSSIGKYYIPRISIADDRRKNGSFTLLYDQNQDLYKEIISAHEKINQLIHFPNGVTHSEFFIKDGDVYFSEIAIRYGGGRVPEMIQNTYGIDLIDAWLKQECGEELFINTKKENLQCSSWINFVPEKPGIIVNIPKKKEFLKLSGIKEVYYHMREGDLITFSNPSEWVCCIVFEAADESSLLEKIEEIYKNFKIITKPEE